MQTTVSASLQISAQEVITGLGNLETAQPDISQYGETEVGGDKESAQTRPGTWANRLCLKPAL